MQTLDQGILIVVISSMFILALMIAFLLFINSYIKRNTRHRIEKLQLKAYFDQTLLQAELEINEKTLTHIASELHDNLGQIASLIKINLLTLELINEPKMEKRLEDTRELVRRLLLDLKNLSSSLNGDRVTRLGLLKGLENEVEMMNKTDLFRCVLTVEGEVPALDENTTTILFRMSQEILHNIVKHSEAKSVNVRIEVDNNFFKLQFVDDGIGFDVESKIVSGGSGLVNLRKRAQLIKADIYFESHHERGTVITIQLPC